MTPPPRQFRRPRIVRASSLKRKMRGASKETVTAAVHHAEAATITARAGTSYEAYRTYMATTGSSVTETAKHFGVSRQAVSQALRPEDYRKRTNAAEQRRYAAEQGVVRPYICRHCGEAGHNRKTCPALQSEPQPCARCGATDHEMAACPASPRKYRCHRCGGLGHPADSCKEE